MLISNQNKVRPDRRVKEIKLEVDDWFLDVIVIVDDEPEPPPSGRSPLPDTKKNERLMLVIVEN